MVGRAPGTNPYFQTLRTIADFRITMRAWFDFPIQTSGWKPLSMFHRKTIGTTA